MSDFEITAGATSRRIGVWLADSSSTTGAGLTGLLFNSAGLTCYYWRENEGNVGATAVTLATATRGTFASGGFIEKDATNFPGAYEFGIPDAALATGPKWVKIMFKGATNLAQRVITIKLSSLDTDTALASQTVGTATAVTNRVTANVDQFGGIAATTAGGRPEVNTSHWAGALTATDDTALKGTLAKTTDITGFNDLSAAQVKTEVVDGLNVDTYAEPGQGAPAATATLAAKINYLYKAFRNRKTQTSTTWSLYNDDAVTVDQKSTVSDDGTTASFGEVATGP